MDDTFYYLQKICASSGFVRASRITRFLTHIVAKSQRGETNDLHLSALAQDLWGCTDKTTDVKAAALRLREKLADYYANEGQSDAIRIEVPEGAYVARIHDRRASLPTLGTLPANQNLAKRRLHLLLDDDDNLFVQVKRTDSGQLSVEVVELGQPIHCTPPVRQSPAAGPTQQTGRAEDEFSQEELNTEVVTLVKGVNSNGIAIYSYVALRLHAFIAMARKIRDEEPFKASDYGEVLANGPGEPSADLKRELARAYGLPEEEKNIPLPRRLDASS